MNTNRWEVSRAKDGVFVIDVYDWNAASSFCAFVCSDQHHDSAHSNHALEKAHMDQVVSLNAPAIFYGDTFCAMQGKFDKRASKDEMPKELREGYYFDEIVRYNHSFYKDYRKHIAVVGKGNHETSVEFRHETDLCQRLVDMLNAAGDCNVYAASYCFWVVFRFRMNGRIIVRKCFCHHGGGGAAQQTKGMLDVGRMAEWQADADICCLGHNHQNYSTYNKRLRLNSHMNEFEDICLHVRTPGYKNPHTKKGGYAIQNLYKPTVQGGGWLKFSMKPGHAEAGLVDITFEAAI